MKHAIFAASFLVLGLIAGFYAGTQSNKESTEPTTHEVRLGTNTFTNPLLECEVNGSVGEMEYKPSKAKINSYIAGQLASKSITHASVYWRDLNNGPWFGINERENFSPASLLKLPVFMAFLKKAENDPELLTKKIKYLLQPIMVAPSFAPEETLNDGKEYTILNLLTRMIVYSDNPSLLLLEKQIDEKDIDRITEDLGIETATDTTPEDFMSVKSYASLFRVLFNASYLNREMSEKALGILAQSAFTKGIVSGLPKDLTVAHKFGERELDNGVKQLHDCGIVYMPRHPYLLCVMTRGTEYEALESVIATVSKNIYEDLSARFK